MRTVVFFALLAATLLPATAGAAPSAADKTTAQRISRHLQAKRPAAQLPHRRDSITTASPRWLARWPVPSSATRRFVWRNKSKA